MAGYIPKSDIEFDQWLEKFKSYVVAHATQIGISSMEMQTLVAKWSDWKTAYNDAITATTVYHGKIETKDDKQDDAEKYARYIAQRTTTYAGTSDEDREGMRITVRDTEPTPIPEDVVITTPTPIVFIDHSQKKTAIVHFGANPQNENQNAKPNGIKGAKIWFHIGGLPAEGEEWEFLAYDTNSPYNHIVNNDAAMTIAYRAQWFDKRMRIGPLGDPIVVAISP